MKYKHVVKNKVHQKYTIHKLILRSLTVQREQIKESIEKNRDLDKSRQIKTTEKEMKIKEN